MPWYLRLASGFGGVLLIYPGLVTDTAGILLVGLTLVVQYVQSRSHASVSAA